MARDFNLLTTLDILLAEGSVARAAKRLQLSPSAMSRALSRLRETTGDPLLVRAGRGLVATPRAIELRDRVRQLVQDVEAVLRPNEIVDITALERTFTIRASDGFAESIGPTLIRTVREQAPRVGSRIVTQLNSPFLQIANVVLSPRYTWGRTGPLKASCEGISSPSPCVTSDLHIS